MAVQVFTKTTYRVSSVETDIVVRDGEHKVLIMDHTGEAQVDPEGAYEFGVALIAAAFTAGHSNEDGSFSSKVICDLEDLGISGD